jgi:hypothetical protein
MHLRAFEAQSVMCRRAELEDALMSRSRERLLLRLLLRRDVEARLLLEAQQRLVLLHDRGRAAAADGWTDGSSGASCALALALPGADVSAGSHAGGEGVVCVRQLALCVRAIVESRETVGDARCVLTCGVDPVHVASAWSGAEALPL